MILIITNKNDSHSDLVISKLHEKNVDFVRFNTEDFPQKFQLDISNNKLNKINSPVGKFNLRKIKSVWYRRPKKPTINADIKDQALKSLSEKESKMTLKWFYNFLSDKLWVNHPIHNKIARDKLLQYRIAKKLGIKHPDFLITSNPKTAKKFIKNHKEVVVKPIAGGDIKRENGYKVIYTNKISNEDIKNLNSIQHCPTFFQEYINKKFELRVTVVDNNVFACKIDSQSSEKTKHDWRRYDFENVEHSKFNLPNKIEKICVNITKDLNLKFGAIDLIVTPDNKYVFLEINANGQWGWIENLTNLRISDSLIKLLTS